MGWPTALPDSEVDYLATLQFATNCYLLVWGNEVVFKARVNQATFEDDFASITWDTAATGFAYTDALEGYVVWLSATDDIRASYTKYGLRLRTAATATTLPVKYTSIQPSDDDYIFVTKDVRPGMKAPKSLSLADYDLSYYAPAPIISNLRTVYYAQIDADGNADVDLFEPEATAIASGAAISTWGWSADGGSFIVGGAGTQDVQLRYTTPGWYMPRVTATDDNGNASWFTPFVFVAPNDLTSTTYVVNMRFSDIQISADGNGGWNTSVPFWGGVENVLNGTMCAVYMPHKTSGNKMIHCGRIRTEGTTYTATGKGAATFNIEGIAQQMNNLRTVEWRFVNTASPTTFNHIKDLTLWRFTGRYIRDFTNINNTHSLEFDDVTDDYEYLSYFLQKGTTLDSLRNQLWSVNSDFEFTSDGMMKLVRNALYTPTADRAALTTVANFSFKHFSGKSADDVMYSLDLDHSLQVGRAIAGIGWYNSTSGNVSVIKGQTPSVIPSRGTENTAVDRQILKADITRAAAETEGSQRTRNDFAAKQAKDTIRLMLPPGFLGKINPSVSQWYTFTITVFDGIRNITYTTADNWLLTDLTIAYSVQFGGIVLDTTFQIETDSLQYSVDIQDPAPATAYNVPVLPPQSPYPSLPVFGDLMLPTGAVPGDEQPVSKKDKDLIDAGALPTYTTGDPGGNVVIVWTATQVFLTREFALYPGASPWTDVTPGGISGTIKEVVFDGKADSKEAVYCIANEGTLADPQTHIYYNPAIGQIQTWQSVTLTDMLATQIRVNKKDESNIYGKFKTFVAGTGSPLLGLNGNGIDMSGDGSNDLLPSSESGSHADPVTNAPGVYDAGNDRYNGALGDNGGWACNIEWSIPPGATITSVSMSMAWARNTTASGEKFYSVSIDGVTIPGMSDSLGVALGEHTLTDSVGGLSLMGTKMVFHLSIDRLTNSYVRITAVSIGYTAAADYAGTRYSQDKAATYDPAIGVGLSTLGDGSFDIRYNQSVFAGMDEKVRKALLVGSGYSDETNGAIEAGQYAKALWHFGRTTDNYLIAPDGGTVGLAKAIEGVGQTDITPNDGAADGFVIGPGGLAMSNIDEDYVWDLASFGGSIKLAYTSDLGTSWAFNTDPTSDATWLTVSPRNLLQVYIAQGSSILYSSDGGVNLVAKSGPAANLLGVLVL